MPFIGASHTSNDIFRHLKEKHAIGGGHAGVSVASSVTSMEADTPERYATSGSASSALEEKLEAVSRGDDKAPGNLDAPKLRSVSVSSAASQGQELDTQELLTFPNESTHAYSYNPLSPNSLAVRLSILKRSLEIMIKNPSLLRDTTSSDDLAPLPSIVSRYSMDRTYSASVKRSPMDQPPQQLRNASSAALSALFNGPVATTVPSSQSLDTQSPPMLSPSLGTVPAHSGSGSFPFRQQQLGTLPIAWEIGSDTSDSPETASELEVRRFFHESPSLASLPEPSQQQPPQQSIYDHHPSHSSEFICEKKRELEGLLTLLNDTLENKDNDKASDLLMISLLNINKLSLGVSHNADGGDPAKKVSNEQELKKQLLESLAQPFHEYATKEPTIQASQDENYLPQFSDELTSIQDPIDYSRTYEAPRILHTFISGKYTAPQAIFTCSQHHPWQFRAANDLACLIFGISKLAFRALTLLDLIHTDSRSFVLNKIMSTEGQEQVFTGEIVGVIQPGVTSLSSPTSAASSASSHTQKFIWASMWAKRKNGMIVCVFEKVPCDYMNVMLNLDDFSVRDISGGEGLQLQSEFTSSVPPPSSTPKAKSVKFANEINDVAAISRSLANLIEKVKSGELLNKHDDLLPLPVRVNDHINSVRYFTLNHLSINIPCAVTSSILEDDLKLQIHSLPYQAGMFIVNSKTLQLISFNKSISKNMFGLHYIELINQPITKIIPSFPSLLKYNNTMYPHLDINLPKNKGLVLTEHYFRKLQSQMNRSAEDFYSSIGIDAVHRDGCTIKVDIQLRVLNMSHILLWITHSRDVFFKNYNTNPSQLKILNEREIATISSGTNSATSSKHTTDKFKLEELSKLKSELQTLTLHIDGRESNSNAVAKSECVLSDDMSTAVAEETDVNTTTSSMPLPGKDSMMSPDSCTKWEIAKKYTQDKSQFVSDDNFKVDENLILHINSSFRERSDSPLHQFNSDSGSPFDTSHMAPEREIGASKHVTKFSDFTVLQKMGEGAYGKVDLCMHKKEKYVVVIKLIFKERILVDTWVRDRKLGTIPSEIQIMATLNKKPHENIMRLLDFFEDDDYYYIESPMHGETGSIDLFDLIELKTNMTEHEAKLLFKQVASGLRHLHENGIVHRDIKDENVIVDNRGRVKIIDFGSAAYVKRGPFDVFVGTIDYAAPEVLGGDPYEGKPQDVWAVGVLLYTIIYKENPFYNIDEILDGDLRISPAVVVSEECVALITRILNRSVNRRPTVDDICSDKWLGI
ncbi:AaceriACR281Cp [[Ashbya] aceris (nom. inval.)]|nr:AaceriACR281Cp [[Ashbya] aceris (nom. inval.)]